MTTPHPLPPDDYLRGLAHLDYRTFTQNVLSTMHDELNEYFKVFVQLPVLPEGHADGAAPPVHNCIGCGYRLTTNEGVLQQLMLAPGGFTWGITNGEGHCAYCFWPARAHHYIKDAEGNQLAHLHHFPLQYHPEHLDLDVIRESLRMRMEGESECLPTWN